jgi:hypothetical protein
MNRKLLAKIWLHSFEEDRDGREFYRPNGYSLPLARGRKSLDLTKDQDGGIRSFGAADLPESTHPAWVVDGDVIEFRKAEGDVGSVRFQIIDLGPDKLVLERMMP